MSRPLHPDVMLGIRLSTICSRNRHERDTAPVIAELLDVAGDRGDVLAFEAGRWAGYYDDEHTAALVAAIIAEIPGAAAWTHVGQARLSAPAHGTTGFGPRTSRRPVADSPMLAVQASTREVCSVLDGFAEISTESRRAKKVKAANRSVCLLACITPDLGGRSG